MKKDQLIDMIGEAPDEAVYDAAEFKRKKLVRHARWLFGIAAVMAVVIAVNLLPFPSYIKAQAVAAASDSRKTDRPSNGVSDEIFNAWKNEREERAKIVESAADCISAFAERCQSDILSDPDGKNRVWSPLNAYIALAMTAELTGSDTQSEVLTVLGIDDLTELRRRISAVWEEVYTDNGKEICVLANSLWLDDGIDYVQSKMDTLAYSYYASVYRGDLQSERTSKDIAGWISDQTGGFLGDYEAAPSEKDAEKLLTMVSTVYMRSKWTDEFDSKNSTAGVFHAPGGAVDCTYMNAEKRQLYYYFADDYGAVKLYLENGCSMWFILPDEDKSINDVLTGGDYMAMISQSDDFPNENHKYMKVNLSIPKFDAASGAELKDTLKSIGLERIFEPIGNDFTPSIESDIPVYLNSISQESRVTIDENGVTAASYIVLDFEAGAAAPPDEIIDFVLDRPFVFAICKDKLPLFVGTVNTP